MYNGPSIRARLLSGMEYGSHNSAKYAYAKCAVAEILPIGVDTVIALDTDVRVLYSLDTIIEDTMELGARKIKEAEAVGRHAAFENASSNSSRAKDFSSQKMSVFFGLAAEQSLYYLRRRHESYMWPFPNSGLNSGVVVMNLKGMREGGFAALWRTTYALNIRDHGIPTVADQDVFNAMAARYPYSYVELPCEWNFQLNRRCACSHFPKAVHALTSVGDISCLGEYVRQHLCSLYSHASASEVQLGQRKNDENRRIDANALSDTTLHMQCLSSCTAKQIARVPFLTLGLRSQLSELESEGIVSFTIPLAMESRSLYGLSRTGTETIGRNAKILQQSTTTTITTASSALSVNSTQTQSYDNLYYFLKNRKAVVPVFLFSLLNRSALDDGMPVASNLHLEEAGGKLSSEKSSTFHPSTRPAPGLGENSNAGSTCFGCDGNPYSGVDAVGCALARATTGDLHCPQLASPLKRPIQPQCMCNNNAIAPPTPRIGSK